MIDVVNRAEEYLEAAGATESADAPGPAGALDGPGLMSLATLRLELGRARGKPVVARLDRTSEARSFADSDAVETVASRGPLTPDHVIRTKPLPLIAGEDWGVAIGEYADAYNEYFERNSGPEHTRLDAAPRWIVWPGVGSVGVGDSVSAAGVVSDITRHTRRAIRWAEKLGGWQPLSESDLFDVEYWELEQAKLRRAGGGRRFDGQVALVTGAASGIGRAVAEAFHREGAAVVATDVDPKIRDLFDDDDRVGIVADITDPAEVQRCVEEAVLRFGGLDLLVCSAGFFPESRIILRPWSSWVRRTCLHLGPGRAPIRWRRPE